MTIGLARQHEGRRGGIDGTRMAHRTNRQTRGRDVEDGWDARAALAREGRGWERKMNDTESLTSVCVQRRFERSGELVCGAGAGAM